MSVSTALLLTGYCVAIACVSLAGGLLPDRIRMTHTRTQLVMSLVSGLMLGVAFFHLLPHSIALGGEQASVDRAVDWLMVGLIAMLLMLRLFNFHQHDFSPEEDEHHDHPHAHHHHDHGQPDQPAAHGASWIGVALGLGLHSVIDGIALGAVMRGDTHTSAAGALAGFGVFMAVLLHKPLDAMSVTTIMQAGGSSRMARMAANLLFALLCPLGALAFYFGVDLLTYSGDAVVAGALAFSAGAFVCIALSDLLPEVHFHSHDRFKLTTAFLLGIALAYSIGVLEPHSFHH
ncbi:ZIP family metal transporter [Haliea sp. E17]|uniref:ZIP family metal transporter n=1 Tax=Haliea sp. E17 TaxID=3401576 RepID=UPI003AB08335